MTTTKTNFTSLVGEEFGSKLDYLYSKNWDGEWTKIILGILIFYQKAVAEGGNRKRFENYTVDELHHFLTKAD
jgi:hypothetical protein